MFVSQMNLQMARRAEVFRGVLEDVRQVRAEAHVLVGDLAEGEGPWARLGATRDICDRLGSGVEENQRLFGRELSEKVRLLLGALEVALSELTLSVLLGPDDEWGRGARGRARHSVDQDSLRLESAIRADMAALMVFEPTTQYS